MIVGPLAPVANNEEYIPFGYGTPDPTYVLEHTPPQISLESPLNQTYTDSNVSLIFSVNKNITSASYSLDGQQNVTITGNSTIANLTNGPHNVTIYATDTYGNIGIQTVNFSVAKTEMKISANTSSLVIMAVPTAVIFICVGLLLYIRHRKTPNLNK